MFKIVGFMQAFCFDVHKRFVLEIELTASLSY